VNATGIKTRFEGGWSMHRLWLTMLAGLTLCTLATGAADAQTEITASLWVSPKHPVAVGGYDPMIADMKKSGDWDVQYFTGGALLGANATLGGLGDGIADVGMIALTYFPAELPHGQLVADLALATESNVAASLAVSEFNMLHCSECLAEFEQQNLVYTGTYSTSPYSIISNEPISAIEDLGGKKMRVPGSVWSRWAKHVGGVEVNVPSSEMYEGLNRGALDIAIQAPGALRSYGLWDIAKNVNLLNLGTYHSLAQLAFNRDFWQELTDEQRRYMLDQAARANLDATLVYTETDEEVLAEAEKHGVTVVEPSEALRQDHEAFVQQDLKTVAEVAKSTYGIENPGPKIETLLSLFDKWQKIVEETGGEREALLERFKTEVYDKVDPATYGMG
jgi:TRAP-type C4-dicarboxylate transport system substrate-binding protein